MAKYCGFRALVLAACAVAVAGCSTGLSESGGLRKAIGVTAKAPDEFLVVSKAPLVMPPDMNLRPPRSGAPDLGTVDLRAQARSSITGAGPDGRAVAGSSPGELAILSRANAGQSNPSVRDDLLADEGAIRKDARLLDGILGEDETSSPLDPWSESERLRRETGGTRANATPAGATPAGAAVQPQSSDGQPTSILLEDILGGGASAN